MNRLPVIIIFDVGKTNKKMLLFNEQYEIVYEESTQLEEIKDEDNFPCEDIMALTEWVKKSFQVIVSNKKYLIKGVNISAYGASFVYLDGQLNLMPPLYNYLKPYAINLRELFYCTYGGEYHFAKRAASPVLGSLNSGMQLYRLKYNKPEVFSKVKYALHLPQYLSFILTGKTGSDITSIGCHTNLWNFQDNKYHPWVKAEGIYSKLAPIMKSDSIAGNIDSSIPVGIGLHDSSAALIPYLICFTEPFILLATGTWCIAFNPFNHNPLSELELKQDCLCYLSYKGMPVKASRLFAGYEHEQQIKRLSDHFGKALNYYKTVQFDLNLYNSLQPENRFSKKNKKGLTIEPASFAEADLNSFKSYEEAYHQFMGYLVNQQIQSVNLVVNDNSVKRLFVDGGFSTNSIYMHLLAKAYPDMKVYSASLSQASALGAALAIHRHWNSKAIPINIFDLKLYTATMM